MNEYKKSSFIAILKSIILKNTDIGRFYSNKYPNTKYTIELILTNIIYVLKTGIAWRNLVINPLIKWQTIYFHFNRFVKHNIFKTFFIYLRDKFIKNHNSNIKLIDSSFILNKYGRDVVSRNKFFKNKNCNKISVLTDENGTPLSVLVNKGTVHDSKFFEPHFNDIKHAFEKKTNNRPFYLLADKAYESKKIRNKLITCDYDLIIAPKKNLKIIYYFDKVIYKKRIHVEHTFQRLKAFKRIQIRYDQYIDSYYNFVYLASAFLIFNKLY